MKTNPDICTIVAAVLAEKINVMFYFDLLLCLFLNDIYFFLGRC